jgi:hypothetical protein
MYKLTGIKSTIKLAYQIFPVFKWQVSTITGLKDRFKNNLLRIKQIRALENLDSKLRSSISAEEKIVIANQWIQKIGSINNRNKELVLFNQPLLSGNKTKVWTDVFNPFKLIVVYRDPKDQLAEIVKKGILYAPYGAPNVNYGGVALESIYGRSRKAAISIHIDAIKKRMEWIDSLYDELGHKQMLLVDFEGLVNKYDECKAVISSFIGIKEENHTKSKLFFDPKNAKTSIGISPEYLSKDELQSLGDLEKWYSSTIRKTQVLFKSLNPNLTAV